MTTQQPNGQKRAEKLPPHQPGVVVTIPLQLLPIYYAAHRLEAMGPAEITGFEKRTGQIHKFTGPVWVERMEQVGQRHPAGVVLVGKVEQEEL